MINMMQIKISQINVCYRFLLSTTPFAVQYSTAEYRYINEVLKKSISNRVDPREQHCTATKSDFTKTAESMWDR